MLIVVPVCYFTSLLHFLLPFMDDSCFSSEIRPCINWCIVGGDDGIFFHTHTDIPVLYCIRYKVTRMGCHPCGLWYYKSHFVCQIIISWNMSCGRRPMCIIHHVLRGIYHVLWRSLQLSCGQASQEFMRIIILFINFWSFYHLSDSKIIYIYIFPLSENYGNGLHFTSLNT